jgi:Immunity protein 26
MAKSTRRKKVKWNNGDVFLVPLKDGRFSIGQVLDLRWVHCVRCALYNEIVDERAEVVVDKVCKKEDLISLIEVFKENLDYGEWRVIGNKPILIPKENYPNEQYKHKNGAGATTYDPGLAEDFLNAFYGLEPWDDWYDPNFLDEFLIDLSKKPANLIYIKRN